MNLRSGDEQEDFCSGLFFIHTCGCSQRNIHVSYVICIYYNIMYIKSKCEKNGQSSGLGWDGGQEKRDSAALSGGRPL